MLASKGSLILRQKSSSLLRCYVPKAYFSVAAQRPGRRKDNEPDLKPRRREASVSPVEILKQLKDPINRARKTIGELEKLLLTHEHNQAQHLAQFNNKLEEINRLEPQREWYYQQLGLPKEDKEKPT